MLKINIRYLKTGIKIGISKKTIIKYYLTSCISSGRFSFFNQMNWDEKSKILDFAVLFKLNLTGPNFLLRQKKLKAGS